MRNSQFAIIIFIKSINSPQDLSKPCRELYFYPMGDPPRPPVFILHHPQPVGVGACRRPAVNQCPPTEHRRGRCPQRPFEKPSPTYPQPVGVGACRRPAVKNHQPTAASSRFIFISLSRCNIRNGLDRSDKPDAAPKNCHSERIAKNLIGSLNERAGKTVGFD